jgi:hypothetical protein
METFLRLLKLYGCSWKTLPNFGMSALDGKNGLGPPALRNRKWLNTLDSIPTVLHDTFAVPFPNGENSFFSAIAKAFELTMSE